MEKERELKEPTSCLNKAAPDEPIFVLRAQDKLAPALVRLWAELAEMHEAEPAKVLEALRCAEKMELWKTRKFPT